MGNILINGENIEYIVKKSNIKHLYIGIKNGEVIVKTPLFYPTKEIDKLVIKKANWIYIKLNEYKERKVENNYTKVNILGEKYLLKKKYINGIKSSFVFNEQILEISLPVKCLDSKENKNKLIDKIVDKIYFEIAELEVEKSIKKTIDLTNLNPLDYKIKRLKRVWGSCSSKKTITINSRLMQFDRQVIDYVMLHELCHLKHMNHSKSFWNLVEKYMSNYKIFKNKLKKT